MALSASASPVKPPMRCPADGRKGICNDCACPDDCRLYNAGIVAKLLGGYTESELSEAFNLVAPKPNWKAPIKCGRLNVSVTERARISYAITFYTGSVATWALVPGAGWAVEAAGYYAAIGP